jgi:hypothetical protein
MARRKRYGGRGTLAQYITGKTDMLRQPRQGSPQLPRLNSGNSPQPSTTGKRGGPAFSLRDNNANRGSAMAATPGAVTDATQIHGVPRQGEGSFEDRYRAAAFERDQAQQKIWDEMGLFTSPSDQTPEQQERNLALQGGAHTNINTQRGETLRPRTVTEAYGENSSSVSTRGVINRDRKSTLTEEQESNGIK